MQLQRPGGRISAEASCCSHESDFKMRPSSCPFDHPPPTLGSCIDSSPSYHTVSSFSSLLKIIQSSSSKQRTLGTGLCQLGRWLLRPRTQDPAALIQLYYPSSTVCSLNFRILCLLPISCINQQSTTGTISSSSPPSTSGVLRQHRVRHSFCTNQF